MKGLVPYAGVESDRFPHSLEFDYIPLNEVMAGMGKFDWQPVERRLTAISGRGCQAILRFWLEYPGKAAGLPDFLQQSGVRLTEWRDGGATSFTPDYGDERLVAALESFILAMGRRYDGDARLGYLTAGLLGSWGEWHTSPREELFASKAVQDRVMAAYEQAFSKTPVLLRYPAGEDHARLAPNTRRPFGYHDDSFAWGTLATGRPQDSWFFLPALAAAKAREKWRTQPIGGEIRPELWGIIFDEKPAHPQAQDFAECVRETHVTWLMDSGMFRDRPDPGRAARASEAVRLMGYDFFASEVEFAGRIVSVTVPNHGVAPFYARWAAELAALTPEGSVRHRWRVDWQLAGISPGTSKTFHASLPGAVPGEPIALRVINPLPGEKGKALRFANADQDADAPGWLTLGSVPTGK